MVPFLLWHKSDIPPDLLRAVHELPGSPGARRARAVVEHTRKPSGLPRPERRGLLRAGTPAGRGRVGPSGQGFEFPMLQPPFFRRKNFGLASLLVCQANFFIE